MSREYKGTTPVDRKLTMNRKEKVIDALLDLSVELSGTGMKGTNFGEMAAMLERITSGLPRASAQIGGMLALALEALRAVDAGGICVPDAVINAVVRVINTAARDLAGENTEPPVDSPEHPANVLRTILETQDAGAVHPGADPALPDLGESEAARTQRPNPQTIGEPARLSPDTDMEILEEFVVESLEHISGIEATLLGLRGVPGDAENINTVFRGFHTIKGSANMLGLEQIQKLGRLVEDILVRARKGDIQITAALIEQSTTRVDSGVQINQEVGKVLDEIGENSQKVSVLVAEIAVSSNEQAQGIDENPQGPCYREKQLIRPGKMRDTPPGFFLGPPGSLQGKVGRMTEKSINILLVEDSRTDARIIMKMLADLEGDSYCVTWVQTLPEALKTVTGNGIDLVLLDLNLCGSYGVDTFTKLHSEAPQIPIVVLTSSKEQQDLIKSYEHHCNSFIRKPVDFTQFAESIRQLGLYWLLLNEPPPPRE